MGYSQEFLLIYYRKKGILCYPKSMKRLRVIIPVAIVSLILFSVFFAKSDSQSKVAGVQTQASQLKVTQNIFGGEKPVNTTYRGKVERGTTALQLLREQAKVIIKGKGENAFVTAINDRKADESIKEFWAMSINGKPSTVGAGSYQLQDGDIVEWKIEKY